MWSPTLAACILEACSQLDSFWKASANQSPANGPDIRDHFVRFGESVAGRWLVAWGDEGRELCPFASWNPACTRTKADYQPLGWWQAHNDIKHDRWANIRQATLENAVNAVAGLFLAIVRSAECVDALVEANWFRSSLATSYAVGQTSDGTESPEFGISIESAILSYASGSSHAGFERNLIRYRCCTHRFCRWLENKYGRSIMLM